MYECVMGLRKHEGQGCILADEMQALAYPLILLRQLVTLSPQGNGKDSSNYHVNLDSSK